MTAPDDVTELGPTVQLCWRVSLSTPKHERCDRRKGHTGPHSWAFAVCVEDLLSRIDVWVERERRYLTGMKE